MRTPTVIECPRKGHAGPREETGATCPWNVPRTGKTLAGLLEMRCTEARKPNLECRREHGARCHAGHLRAEQAGPWASRPLPSVGRPLPTTDVPARVRLPWSSSKPALGSGQVQGALGREVQGLGHKQETKVSPSSPCQLSQRLPFFGVSRSSPPQRCGYSKSAVT